MEKLTSVVEFLKTSPKTKARILKKKDDYDGEFVKVKEHLRKKPKKKSDYTTAGESKKKS